MLSGGSENGDGPTHGFDAFSIADGRFEIATGETVTNYFPSQTWVGIPTTASGTESAGHLDIRNGVNIFEGELTIGRYNGTKTTAPEGISSTIDVYGGENSCTVLNMAYGADPKFTMRPAFNVHGGSFTAKTAIRLFHTTSKCDITVDGGNLSTPSVVLPYYNDGGGSGAELSVRVADGGRFDCSGTFLTANTGEVPAKLRVNAENGGEFCAKKFNTGKALIADTVMTLTGGGVLETRVFNGGSAAKTAVHFDGGVIRPIASEYSGEIIENATFYVGAKGMMLDLSQSQKWGSIWKAPVRPERDVADGGITLRNFLSADRRSMRLATDDISVSGGMRLENAELMLMGSSYSTTPAEYDQTIIADENSIVRAVAVTTTVERLEFPGVKGNITFGTFGPGKHDTQTNFAHLAVGNFVPPSGLIELRHMRFDTTSSYRPRPGTYDLLSLPAKDAVDISKFIYMTANADLDYHLSSRMENGRQIITLTVSPAGIRHGVEVDASDAWKDDGSPWWIGSWLYAHNGTMTTYAPLTLYTPANRNAGISVASGEKLTLAGGIEALAGGFVKLGEGDLALTGDKGYRFGRTFTATDKIDAKYSGAHALFDGGTNGAPSVRTHDGSLTVARGKLTIGTGTDNPYVRLPTGTLCVGTLSTAEAGGEGDAAMEVKSGYLDFKSAWFTLGFCHGTPATAEKDPLVSSYYQSGGTVDVSHVDVAYDYYAKVAASMDSSFTIDDGLFECRNYFYLGRSNSEHPYRIAFTQNGGECSVGRKIYETKSGSEGRMILKYDGPNDVVIDYVMNGGTMTFWDGFSCYNNGTITVNLNGGRINVCQTFNGGDGTTLNWNGTVLAPFDNHENVPPYFRYFKKVNVLEGGAIIDTSRCRYFDFDKAVSGPGRIVVRGSNTNACVRLYDAVQALGGVTVEKGGLVIARGKSGESLDFLVQDGGAICDYYGNTVKSLTMGENESDVTVLYGYYLGGSRTCLSVTNGFSTCGKVLFAFRDATYPNAFSLPAGESIALYAPKGTIDPSRFELHPDIVARGASGTFAVKSVSDTMDALVVSATAGIDEHTWIADGSGNWTDVEKWDSPPTGLPHASVIFPAERKVDVTVKTTADSTAQKIYQNAKNAVRFDGPFRFAARDVNDNVLFDIAEPDGVLDFSGPVSVGPDASHAVTMSRTAKGGTLRVSGSLADAPVITKNSGYTEGAPEAFGEATLNLNNSILRFLNSGICRATINNASGGLGLEVQPGKTVRIEGKLTVKKNLSVIGGGRVELACPGSNVTGGNATSAEKRPVRDVTTGDAPFSSGLGIYAGTLAVDGGPDSTYKLSSAGVDIGKNPIPDGTGGAYEARLEVRSGAVTIPKGLGVGGGVKEAYDSPFELGLKRRPVAAVDVYGGSLTVGGDLTLNYAPSGTGPARYRSDGKTKRWDYFGCSRAELNVYGGTFTVNGGYCGLPYHDSITAVEEGSGESLLNVYGGVFETTKADISIGRYSDGYNDYPARGSVNIYGGVVRTPADKALNLSQGQTSVGSLNLHGGVLETGKIKRGTTSARTAGHVYFNGGIFRPLENGNTISGLTSFTVGKGGAKFDLTAVQSLTLGQALTSASDLGEGETDGGITLLSASAQSVLTLAALNDIRGPLTVNGGTMRPVVESAAGDADGVVVNSGGVFDANEFAFTFHSLAGEGGLYSNGVVTVTGVVAPSNTTFTVEDIVFADGAVLSCPVEGDVTSGFKAPYLTVAKSVTKDGNAAIVDLGLSGEKLLPKNTSVKIAELFPGVVFPQMQIINACDERTTARLKRQVREDGVTEVYVNVVPKAIAILIR